MFVPCIPRCLRPRARRARGATPHARTARGQSIDGDSEEPKGPADRVRRTFIQLGRHSGRNHGEKDGRGLEQEKPVPTSFTPLGQASLPPHYRHLRRFGHVPAPPLVAAVSAPQRCPRPDRANVRPALSLSRCFACPPRPCLSLQLCPPPLKSGRGAHRVSLPPSPSFSLVL